jgi:hypothetical protein
MPLRSTPSSGSATLHCSSSTSRSGLLPIPWTSVSCAMSALVQVASCRPPLRRSIPTTPATLLSIDSSKPVAQRVARRPMLVGTWQHRRQLLGIGALRWRRPGPSWSAGGSGGPAPELEQVLGATSSFHSAWQARSPRRMNRAPPCTALTCPRTGSVVRLRWALSSLARIAACQWPWGLPTTATAGAGLTSGGAPLPAAGTVGPLG